MSPRRERFFVGEDRVEGRHRHCCDSIEVILTYFELAVTPNLFTSQIGVPPMNDSFARI